MRRITKKSIIIDRINYKKDGRKTPSFLCSFLLLLQDYCFSTFHFATLFVMKRKNINLYAI